MGKVNRAKFKQDSQRGGRKGTKFGTLKKTGLAEGYVHPQVGLYERFPHGGIPVVDQYRSQGQNKYDIRNRRWNCLATMVEQVPHPKCPVCLLQDFSLEKIEKGFDPKEVIFDIGEGTDRKTLDLSGLAGKSGYFSNPEAKQEVVFVWIPSDASIGVTLKASVQIEGGPQTLGSGMIDVIDQQIERRGLPGGDCCVPEGYTVGLRNGQMVLIDANSQEYPFEPYPLVLRYDKDADPKWKYKADKLDRDLAPLTEDIVQIMLAGPKELDINLDDMCASGDAQKMMEGMKTTWASRAIPFAEFEDYVNQAWRSGKPTVAAPPRTEQPPAQPPAAQPTQPPAAEQGMYCPKCGQMSSPGAKFCLRCGAPLGAPEPQPAAQPPAAQPPAEQPPARQPPAEQPPQPNQPPAEQPAAKPQPQPNQPPAEQPAQPPAQQPTAPPADPGTRPAEKTIRMKCADPDCGREVDLMMPSCRCPICGHQHLEVKARLEADDVPF